MQKFYYGLFVCFLLIASLVSLSWALDFRNYNSKITPSLISKMSESSKPVLVTVQLKDGLTKREFGRTISYLGAEKIRESFYPYAFQAELNPSEIVQVSNDRNVKTVAESFELRFFLQDSVQITGAVDVWEKPVGQFDGLDGTGQTICIVDAGVQFSHPDLAAKNILGCTLDCSEDLSSDGSCSVDCSENYFPNYHGTHVAGITGADGGIEGIAKGINLIDAKVSSGSDDDLVSEFSVFRALDWCTRHADEYNISVISMSLGTWRVYENNCDSVSPVYSQLVNYAYSRNISVVVAAGNSAEQGSGISLPACMSHAIPVGAVDKQDRVWWGSNYNRLNKLFAPGVGINSTFSTDAFPGGVSYLWRTGTSMATPMVSASIAIINQYLEATGRGARSMNPLDIEQILFDSGEEIVDLPRENWARINVNNALLAMDEIVPEVTLVSPVHNSKIFEGNYGASVNFECSVKDWQLMDASILIINGSDIVFSASRSLTGETEAEVEFNVSSLSAGNYIWVCKARDSAGNSAEKSSAFRVIKNPHSFSKSSV